MQYNNILTTSYQKKQQNSVIQEGFMNQKKRTFNHFDFIMSSDHLTYYIQDSYEQNNHMDVENQDQLNEEQLQNYAKFATTATKIDTIKINEEDINYKNFPKMIGNNIVKWMKNYKYRSNHEQIPAGLKKLIELRKEDKQSKIKIKDLRESIIDEEESQEVFKEYIADQLYLDLLFSNKVADPFSYIPGISNYYSAANEPEKMKGNYIMRKEFIYQDQ